MKTPIERIAEAPKVSKALNDMYHADLYTGNSRNEQLALYRAVAAEVLRELIIQEFSSPLVNWHRDVCLGIRDFAASLGREVELNEEGK